MSHCNITLRDRHSTSEQQALRIMLLETEKKRLQELLDSAESNLRSIFERIDKDEDVYLCYEDGRKIYIQRAPPEQ